MVNSKLYLRAKVDLFGVDEELATLARPARPGKPEQCRDACVRLPVDQLSTRIIFATDGTPAWLKTNNM